MTTTATQVFSATIHYGEVRVFARDDVPAGTPGTVTAEQAADMTDRDWARLAKSRKAALKASQRARGLHRPMPPHDPSEEYRKANAWADANRLVTVPRDIAGPGHIDRIICGQIVGTWTWEDVAPWGPTWCYRPAGHAYPIRYKGSRPTSIAD